MPDSEETRDEIHDAATFARQRRNVLILSIGLILFQLAGGSLRKIPLGEAWIVFRQVGVLEWAAWLALAYSLFRFYLHRGKRVEEFDRLFHDAVGKLARKYLLRRSAFDLGELPEKIHGIPRRGLVAGWIDARTPFRRIGLVRAGGTIADGRGGQKPVVDIPNPKFRVGLLRAWWYELEAFALVSVRDPIVTELWLPYALSVVAVLIGIFQWLLK